MGNCCCCYAATGRERNRDTELGWYENNDQPSIPPARESSGSDPLQTKLELEGTNASHYSPTELERPVRTQQHRRHEADNPPPYSPGPSRPVVMNRGSGVSDESSRSMQQDIGRSSEDSGFEKMQQTLTPVEPVYDDRKYSGNVR